MNILLLDDDPFALKLLSRQLQALDPVGHGYHGIVPCESGVRAIELLEAQPESFQLVFCDLQMPGMDGVEFVRHLVGTGYGGGIVFVSGEDVRVLQAAERLARAHDLQVVGTLQKPVSIDALRQLLEARRPVTSNARAAHAEPLPYEPEHLRIALREGQLFNHYQPKVDLRTGAVVSVEALVRWQHPADGVVMPLRFIALAEEAGLITEVGNVVLGTALRDLRGWLAAGLELDVAVNVSVASLMSLEFPDQVAAAAAQANVPLHRLVLEVTESRLIDNPRAQLDILTRLRLKHVRLSVDDFGTGYSGLSQLRDLPFAEVKVDQGFVHGAGRDRARSAIVEASLGLARQLRMSTVGEGVEDREDWDHLRAMDCDLAQGYFIARPMPAAQLGGWAREWNARAPTLLS
jgi:EAL domain-containing protein (putative c-di-GMP-specific phosphodiesterase class I)/ActR/RegA family two-component response regulator